MRDTDRTEDWLLNHVTSLDRSIFDQGETDFSPEDFEDGEQRAGVTSDHLMLFMD